MTPSKHIRVKWNDADPQGRVTLQICRCPQAQRIFGPASKLMLRLSPAPCWGHRQPPCGRAFTARRLQPTSCSWQTFSSWLIWWLAWLRPSSCQTQNPSSLRIQESGRCERWVQTLSIDSCVKAEWPAPHWRRWSTHSRRSPSVRKETYLPVVMGRGHWAMRLRRAAGSVERTGKGNRNWKYAIAA